MTLDATRDRPAAVAETERLTIIDCDVHPVTKGDKIAEYLPQRWRDYVADVGFRNRPSWGVTTPARLEGARLDAYPPGGGAAGTDPEFAREQLLDRYDISAAILNCMEAMPCGGSPVELEIEQARAVNDYIHDEWLGSDPRWYSSITITPDHVEAAVEEMRRCVERSPRFVQLFTSSKTERPAGNPKYWPLYEAAEGLGMPLGVHVGGNRLHQWTGCGPAFYYEMRFANPTHAETMVASLIFEGVFDRFPGLKVLLTELGWDWAASFSWRLDATWRVLKGEVPHLQRPPSEYLRDHIWFTVQPAVEPPDRAASTGIFEQFEACGLIDQLVFSSDYPHWDMDAPLAVLPGTLSDEIRHKILSGNAASLYGTDLGAWSE